MAKRIARNRKAACTVPPFIYLSGFALKNIVAYSVISDCVTKYTCKSVESLHNHKCICTLLKLLCVEYSTLLFRAGLVMLLSY
jgi:hypothetical protein